MLGSLKDMSFSRKVYDTLFEGTFTLNRRGLQCTFRVTCVWQRQIVQYILNQHSVYCTFMQILVCVNQTLLCSPRGSISSGTLEHNSHTRVRSECVWVMRSWSGFIQTPIWFDCSEKINQLWIDSLAGTESNMYFLVHYLFISFFWWRWATEVSQRTELQEFLEFWIRKKISNRKPLKVSERDHGTGLASWGQCSYKETSTGGHLPPNTHTHIYSPLTGTVH